MNKPFCILFSRAYRAQTAQIRPRMADQGISMGQPKILHLLTRSSRTQVELARACDIEPATVSKILDLMEQAGMIERVRSDKDRRSIQVQITEFGAQQHAKMSEIHAEVEALALEGFSAEEREQFINYIQRMTDNLRGEKTAALSQVEKMTTQPIPRLITTLAVPTIVSMLITSIYNMADTFFVSQLGTSATGAVGIVFSLMAIIQAVDFTLGIGSGSLISRMLGARKHAEAEKIASTGFFAAIAFGLLLTGFGLFFIDPLMALLGATKTILPYARDYAKYILLGAAVMSSSFVLNNVLRSEGKATLAMVGITAGGLLNIVLDPIFIFTFHLGIAGAAIATILSQIISFLILLSCFLRHKSLLHLGFRNISWKWEDLSAIIKTGLPSFFRQGLASIATVMLNVNAAVYGDAAVAAMSVVGKVFMLILSVLIGFGQGYQPVVGFNYGAGCYQRVKQSFTFTTIVSFVMMGILAAAGFVFAPQVIQLFTKADAQVLEIGTYAMRAQCLALFIQPLGVISNMTFQSIGKPAEATFLSACRQGVFFLPLIIILPRLWQLRGVELTQPLADVLTFIVCFPFLFKFFKELNQKIAEQEGA